MDLHLADAGQEASEKISERQMFFAERLAAAGVDRAIAERDACRVKHAISNHAFRKLKEKVRLPVL